MADGTHDQQLHPMSDAAIDPWLTAGFAADEVSDWCRALEDAYAAVQMPQRAKEWRAAGFGAEGTWWWLHPGVPVRPVTPEWAAFCDLHGWEPKDVAFMDLFLSRLDPQSPVGDKRAWVVSELRPFEALDFIYGGVSVGEAQNLLKGVVGSVFGLQDVLRARANTLSAFQPDVGALINDLVDYHYGRTDSGQLHLEHVHDVRDIANERAAEEQAYQLFGAPSADGVYLVGVIDFSADSNEDGWTYAGMMAKSRIVKAASRLGWEASDIAIDRHASPMIGTLSNGIRLSVIQRTVEGASPWFREARKPHEDECRRWSTRVVL